jgi:hypothetical protein
MGLLCLVLGGCTKVGVPYPDTCVMTQADAQGGGMTTGTFPCKLRHVTVEQAK